MNRAIAALLLLSCSSPLGHCLSLDAHGGRAYGGDGQSWGRRAAGHAEKRRGGQRASERLGRAGRPLPGGGSAAPIPPLSEPNGSTPLHLLISSFLDGERCGKTLGWAFRRADWPDRLRINVLQARRQADADCLVVFKREHLPGLCMAELRQVENCEATVLSQVNAWVIPPELGKGPAHQRGIANSLLHYDREDAMCVSTDAHMGFLPGWDTLLLNEWLSTRNEFAVLTTYPSDLSEMDIPEERRQTYPTFCGYKPETGGRENGLPRGSGQGSSKRLPGEQPHLAINWAAGFSFHRCHAERNVPVDPHLTWLFTGEEANRAVRLWTHGYDLYMPTLSMVTHNYTDAKQEFWSFRRHNDGNSANSRVRAVLEFGEAYTPPLDEPLEEPYTLGPQRTMEQFVRWSRQDMGGKWGQWLKDEGLESVLGDAHCKTLQRLPVDDEEALLGSIGTRPLPSGTIRLSEYPKGHLELYDGGRWASVCGGWPWQAEQGAEDSLCRALGYTGGEHYNTSTARALPSLAVAARRLCSSKGAAEDLPECPSLLSSVGSGSAAQQQGEGCGEASALLGLHCHGAVELPDLTPHHGCCQESQEDSTCADFEYSNGCCRAGTPGCVLPGCGRGFWAAEAIYDVGTRKCVAPVRLHQGTRGRGDVSPAQDDGAFAPIPVH